MYHPESIKIYNKLNENIESLVGHTMFTLGGISLEVEGKDGLGGLIEEWFGVWAFQHDFMIINPKKEAGSQEFPDYYVGDNKGLLEIKAFNYDAGANFDLANFESYCETAAHMPERTDSDYLIFGYRLIRSVLKIEKIWLKKIWEITCPSERWPLKTQTKRNVIYNIRPASWDSTSSKYKTFEAKEDFINALYETQAQYKGQSQKDTYLRNKKD